MEGKAEPLSHSGTQATGLRVERLDARLCHSRLGTQQVIAPLGASVFSWVKWAGLPGGSNETREDCKLYSPQSVILRIVALGCALGPEASLEFKELTTP